MEYKEIISTLNKAEENRNKIAMFHFLTLKYAEEFEDEDPKSFCRSVGMRECYATEFLKMRALHKLMKTNNLKV